MYALNVNRFSFLFIFWWFYARTSQAKNNNATQMNALDKKWSSSNWTVVLGSVDDWNEKKNRNEQLVNQNKTEVDNKIDGMTY